MSRAAGFEPTIRCPAEEDLRALLLGKASPELIEHLEAHLSTCVECEKTVDTLRENRDTVFSVWRQAARNAAAELLLEDRECKEFVERMRRIDVRDVLDGRLPAGESRVEPEAVEKSPTAIGRYQVLRQLGQGGFARVYLARDTASERLVALKVPRRIWSAAEDVEAILDEAETLAALNHPVICPVFDWGRTADGGCYVAMEYVEGRSLRRILKQNPSRRRGMVELVIKVAEALHHCHERGIVHRDIKPSNILVDAAGEPCLVDFGLAVHDDRQWRHRGEFAGTRYYMAPEQVRREAHRLDGRTDIWSLGVVLYEILTGKRPFQDENSGQLEDEIQFRRPKPLRQIDDGVSVELERICMKCLSKNMADRYSSALDLADDLRESWDVKCSTPRRDIGQVIPNGLRSYGPDEASFFPKLLPGDRDRLGLPELIGFWKTRVESRDSRTTMPVGVLYGPSGAGKSSFLRAGLLPRLDSSVCWIYVSATDDRLEDHLLTRIRRECPELPTEARLPEAIELLRLRRLAPQAGEKLLIVIDQFEQWLHAGSGNVGTELVQALRQCDGPAVQCLLAVRDDFWMSTTRFMRELDVPLLDGENCRAIELFEAEHAGNVLEMFGRAYGQLPPEPEPLSAEQRDFVAGAIDQLSDGGKVICIRLSTFAEMVRYERWHPETLRERDGLSGIGERFLDEVFRRTSWFSVDPSRWEAARGVLTCLLPEGREDIAARRRTRSELGAAAGYEHAPNKQDQLLEILNHRLHLISAVDNDTDRDTPDRDTADRDTADRDTVESAATGSADGTGGGDEPTYRLTHDFLVPSLRRWLNRRRRETSRGRARILLEERTALWSAHRESKQLPGVLEWISILALTERNSRTRKQQELLNACTRRYVFGLYTMSALLVFALLVGGLAWGRAVESSARNTARWIQESEIERLPDKLDEAGPLGPSVLDKLRRIRADANLPMDRRVRASVALLSSDPSQAAFLADRLVDPRTAVAELLVVRDELRPGADQLTRRLWNEAVGPEPEVRLRALTALASYQPDHPDWREFGQELADLLLGEPTQTAPRWIDALKPVAPHLAPTCRRRLGETNDPGIAANACSALMAFSPDVAPSLLVSRVADAEDHAFRAILDRLRKEAREESRAALMRELHRLDPTDPPALESEDRRARRIANVVVALWLLDEPAPLLDNLRYGPFPSVRSYSIHALNPRRIPTQQLWDLYRGRAASDEAVRHALLAALGEHVTRPMGHRLLQEIVDELTRLYQNDSSGAVHSTCELLLRRLDRHDRLVAAARNEAHPLDDDALRPGQWFPGPEGFTFVVVEADGRRVAVATKEVTHAKFREKCEHHKQVLHMSDPDPRERGNCPVTRFELVDVLRYCQYLSEPRFDPSQWCYPRAVELTLANLDGVPDMLDRKGYRLPTKEECEAACRAGTATDRFYGTGTSLLPYYGLDRYQSQFRTPDVGQSLPNNLGIFDTYGTVPELCFDKTPILKKGHLDPHHEYWKFGPSYRAVPAMFDSSKFHRLARGATSSSTDETLTFRLVRTLGPVKEIEN